jgi:hypothetical protein
MLIERLDRTQWKLAEAVEHIRQRLAEALPAYPEAIGPTASWQRPRDPGDVSRNHARHEIMIALRDGDLHATGRMSTERVAPWAQGSIWPLHSGHHSPITPEHWRGGGMDWHQGTLTSADSQFIDIRIPRFVVLAIWPEQVAELLPAAPGAYRTPYLDLLDRAIAEWRITEENQPKKDNLLDWFLEQTVEGEKLSENLASAMATLVRMPASQRGGAKRMGG